MGYGQSDDRDFGRSPNLPFPVSLHSHAQVTEGLSATYHAVRAGIVATLENGPRKRAMYGFIASAGIMPALAICAAVDAIAVVQSGLPSQRAGASAAPATAAAAAAGAAPPEPAPVVTAPVDIDHGYRALVAVRRALATRLGADTIQQTATLMQVAEQLGSCVSPVRKRTRAAVDFAAAEAVTARTDDDLDKAHEMLVACLTTTTE